MKTSLIACNTPMVLKAHGYTRGRYSRIAAIVEELEWRTGVCLRVHIDDEDWTGYVVWAGSWLEEASGEGERQRHAVIAVEMIIGNGWQDWWPTDAEPVN